LNVINDDRKSNSNKNNHHNALLVQHFFFLHLRFQHIPIPPFLLFFVDKKNKKASIHHQFFNSESTKFQPTIDQNIRMNFSENIKTHIPVWPRKLTSVMEIHRQRFSKLNQKFKQRPVINLHPPTMYPIILPQASRPQPRQQARSKQQIQTNFPPTGSPRRANTAHIRNQPLSFIPNHQYITLANLTKILHVLQTENKPNDNSDTTTDVSLSTTNSAKQRVQQHLQETATRWWKPVRSSDSHSVPSNTQMSETSTVFQQSSDEIYPSQRNLPLIVKRTFFRIFL
jgi:hypothetical protein